jgi:RNA polymerase sigma factor (sigma-70 family)
MTARERFETLYDAHAGAVLAYVRRRTDPSNADDVAAEVFLIAWRRLEEVPTDARAWLLGVARRVLANQRRGQSRRAALASRLTSEHPSTDLFAGAEPGDARVMRALARLGEKDREALLLLGWEELDNRLAAMGLGIRPRTFSVRVNRARRRFALALADSEEISTDRADPTGLLEAP